MDEPKVVCVVAPLLYLYKDLVLLKYPSRWNSKDLITLVPEALDDFICPKKSRSTFPWTSMSEDHVRFKNVKVQTELRAFALP